MEPEDVSEEEIARAISAGRPYQVQIHKPTSQYLTDLHWAALRAARRIGCKVSVRVARPTDESPLSVTVSPRRQS
jgi:hypothetical protein